MAWASSHDMKNRAATLLFFYVFVVTKGTSSMGDSSGNKSLKKNQKHKTNKQTNRAESKGRHTVTVIARNARNARLRTWKTALEIQNLWFVLG